MHGHSKLVKEFTDLCIVQELNAHNGESYPQGVITAPCHMQPPSMLAEPVLTCSCYHQCLVSAD